MNPLLHDLEAIVERNADDFATLRGARLFITGGTGFVGSWLVESFVHANARLALGASALLLTRDPAAFSASAPHLVHDESITLLRGDVRNLTTMDGTFDAVIHAATPASAQTNRDEPDLMIATIVDGTRRALEVAERGGSIPILLTSSGAVYGRQPADLSLIDESYIGAPDSLDPSNAYHEGKRLSELLCAIADRSGRVQAKIARLFAFVGPYLPLDRHFAIGNFIRDALAGGPIEVVGDGTAVRTYQYAADMTSWLWRILVRGATSRAYNVGSESIVDIRGAATAVAAAFEPPVPVIVRGVPQIGALPQRYACSTHRARSELNLEDWTPFEQALRRTIAWHREKSSPSERLRDL